MVRIISKSDITDFMITESKDLYIRHLPDGMPLYYQPWFLEASDSDWTAYVFMEDGEPVWIWAGVIKRKYGIKKFVSPRYVHVMAPIILKNTFEVETLERIFSLGRMMIADRYHDFDHLDFKRWKKQLRFRQLIDLNNYPTDLLDIKKSKRNKIKKISNLEIELHDNLRTFQPLHENSFERRGKDELPYEHSSKMFDKLLFAPGKSYVFILKNKQGISLAGQWLYGFQDTVYGINRGKNYQTNQKGAQEYLMWHICQKLREKYRFYDLGGSSIPGVRAFNIDMGGQDIEYKIYTKNKIFI